ncbi:MAG: glucosylglycerol 3-phosphatase [Pleurocapsa sp.]
MTVKDASLSSRSLSLDHQSLRQMLIERENILIIQDLDGVCMGLVKDPLTRVMEARYLEAVKALEEHFFVLTNGEHIGQRGVNGIIERTLAGHSLIPEQGWYLPGLAGGGVQWQDCYANVLHPGVSEAEMAFLAAIPNKVATYLAEIGQQPKYGLNQAQLAEYIQATVLDNKISPTANLNVFHEIFSDRPELYAELQQEMKSLTDRLLIEAQHQGLADSFFVHYAPNLGRDEQGIEIMQPAQGNDSGTTDFQFMLRGAIKEVGVIVILNHYYYLQTGEYPLGKNFNAREAPHKQQDLLKLVKDNLAAEVMPTIVGAGDTVTSKAVENNGRIEFKRGGSDRGFLELIQALGQEFDTDNAVVYVDSSGGEVKNRQALKLDHSNPEAVRVIQGPGDSQDREDPLTLNFVFPGGYIEYVDFFCQVAKARKFTQ